MCFGTIWFLKFSYASIQMSSSWVSETHSLPIKALTLTQKANHRSLLLSWYTQGWNLANWGYWFFNWSISSVQSQLGPTLCDPMDCSMPGLPVHHQLLELTQTPVPWVGDAIQPPHPLSSPSPPVFNLSQHQGLFQWICSSHWVSKVLEF